MIVQHDGGIVGLVMVALEQAVGVDVRGSPVALELELDLLLSRPGGVEDLRALPPRQRLQPPMDDLPPGLGQRSMIVIRDGRRAVVMHRAERRQPRACGAVERHRGGGRPRPVRVADARHLFLGAGLDRDRQGGL